jgi:hypothetical protein
MRVLEVPSVITALDVLRLTGRPAGRTATSPDF